MSLLITTNSATQQTTPTLSDFKQQPSIIVCGSADQLGGFPGLAGLSPASPVSHGGPGGSATLVWALTSLGVGRLSAGLG